METQTNKQKKKKKKKNEMDRRDYGEIEPQILLLYW